MNADPVFTITEAAADLGVYLALWSHRDADKPQPTADRAGNEAVAAIDKALLELHAVRSQLVTEIRTFNDDCAVRTDALLERCRERYGR